MAWIDGEDGPAKEQATLKKLGAVFRNAYEKREAEDRKNDARGEQWRGQGKGEDEVACGQEDVRKRKNCIKENRANTRRSTALKQYSVKAEE